MRLIEQMRFGVLGVALAMSAACLINLKPSPPVALRPIAVNFTQTITSGTVQFDGAGIDPSQGGPFPIVNGRAAFPNFPANVPVENVHIRADGYAPYDCVTNIPGGSYDFFVGPSSTALGYGQGWFVGANGSVCPRALTALVPPAPTRDEALHIHLTFQGLIVDTVQFGRLPWFEAALAWLSPADRQAVYAAKHAAGDTTALIMVPNGFPLYDEAGQPYSADRFGALDWTNGMAGPMDPKFAALVLETRQAGFIPLIFMDEVHDRSVRIMPLVIAALQGANLVDQIAAILPGWDGVFYGWDPADIVAWSTLARNLCPNCRLGLEHNQGHIPLGNGSADYAPGGGMSNFDLVLGEYNLWEGHNDTEWQILGRMVRPYNRPSDQPAGDDPNPPFYLGGWNGVYCAFETYEYPWVRVDVNNYGPMQQAIANERAYMTAMGATCGG